MAIDRTSPAHAGSSPDEGRRFEVAVAAACRATGAPVALFSELAGDRESVRASHGWSVDHFPLALSLARLVATADDLLVVNDALKNEGLAVHPLVSGPPRVRFIAGCRVAMGPSKIGALYVLDAAPRTLSEAQQECLRWIAAFLSQQIAAGSLREEIERQRAEVALLEHAVRESDERFTDLFATSDDLIVTIDPSGNVLHRNEPAGEIWHSDAGGSSLYEPVAPDRRDELRASIRRVLLTGDMESIETVLMVRGERVTVEGPLRPKVLDGRVVMARASLRDITPRKDLEEALGRARDAALETSRLKSQFLSNISHEVRTPMNGICGMLDLLLSGQLSTEQREYALIARSSSDQLLSIIDNVLHISQIEAGRMTPNVLDFDLYRTLERIIEVMKVAALGKDIELSYDYDKKLPTIVRGDPSQVRQVVTNIVENAIKFTEHGTVALRVESESATDSHSIVRFSIKDTGIGIAADQLDKLFDPFTQVNASLTRSHTGVGLGLTTARMLVDMMGGVLGVESTPEAGSTFWFSVPLAHPAGRKAPVSSHLDFKKMRVLLVDQSATSRRTIEHYLKVTWEMRVTIAASGSEALEELRSAAAAGDPYLIVLFDRMLDMEAMLFARAIKSDRALSSSALIFLLSLGEKGDDSLLRSVGISARVAKPIGQAELFDALVSAMAHDSLPLAQSISPSRRMTHPPAPVSAEKRQALRILVAEDNLLNLKLTLTQLQKLGYHADSVQNGAAVIESLEKTPYDVILMDCQMPILDGYEASRQIRRLSLPTRPRIIALTAHALDADREKCLAAGMDDYLAKPTRQEQLDLALARFFE